MNSSSKLYVITRNDLTPGYQLAQSCHALREFAEVWPEIDKEWYSTSNRIVVLSTKNELSLSLLVETANELGLRIAKFNEPDMEDQLTAIAIEPHENAEKLCYGMPLALSRCGM